MSQENVEIAQALFDTWNAGDMDAFGELLDPNVVVRPPSNWPEPGPFVGTEETLDQFQRMRDVWEFDVAERVGEFIDNDDRVVVNLFWRGKGHGPDSNMGLACVCTVRDGKCCAMGFFWDHSEALEAAGLEE